jgi:hypothetical protein
MSWYQFIWRVFMRWLEEPIGVVVPLFGLLIILLAPQMPDMFASMEVGVDNGALNLAAGATALGFMGWYWSRAALLAPMQVDDWKRSHDPETVGGRAGRIRNLDPSYEWAPRLVLIWTALICLAPLIMVFDGTMPFHRFSWLHLFFSLILLAVLFVAVIYR